MGIKANTLRYRSKRDGEIIVGSEIRAALDELENENSELRAQLARCVDVLTWCGLMFGVNDMTKCQETIHDFIDVELDQQAKADAEVLRCAEEETKMHKVGVDASGEVSEVECDCKLCHAIRAAREGKDELR